MTGGGGGGGGAYGLKPSNILIIREIFKGDHNAAVARKLRRKQISALSGTLN